MEIKNILLIVAALQSCQATVAFIQSSNSLCSANSNGQTITRTGIVTGDCYTANNVYQKWACSGSGVTWYYNCNSDCSSCPSQFTGAMNTCSSTGFGVAVAAYFKPTSCATDGGSDTTVTTSSLAGGYTVSSQNCVSSACDVACASGYTVTTSGSSFSARSTGSCVGQTCATLTGTFSGNSITATDSNGVSYTGTLSGSTLTLSPVGGSCSLTYQKTSSSSLRPAVGSAVLGAITALALYAA